MTEGGMSEFFSGGDGSTAVLGTDRRAPVLCERGGKHASIFYGEHDPTDVAGVTSCARRAAGGGHMGALHYRGSSTACSSTMRGGNTHRSSTVSIIQPLSLGRTLVLYGLPEVGISAPSTTEVV